MARMTCRRAFELGALAMRRLAQAKCNNLTESLREGIMTDCGLYEAEKRAMRHQVDAIDQVEKDIGAEDWRQAAYYGSYILDEREKAQISALLPDLVAKRTTT